MPLVSICLITYNQVSYVRKAIESIINQNVNFNWELVIADDFSTDGTIEILKEYKNKYPDKIILILRNSNIGAAANWIELINYPKSKYIAYLEGDDYWIDNFKLQKQIDLLESNPNYSMCFTNNVNINNEDKIINEKVITTEFSKDLTHEDILSNNYFIGSGSAVYRRDSIPNPLPELFKKVINGDYLLYAFITKRGKAAYLDITSLAYRLHESGIWTSRSNLKKYWAMFNTFKLIRTNFNKTSETEALRQNLAKIMQNLLWTYLELPKIQLIIFNIKSFFICLRYGIFDFWISSNKRLLKLLFKN